MKINSKHRVLSIILSVLMVLSLMPVAVFADDGSVSDETELIAAIEAVENDGTVKLGGSIALTAKLVIPADKTFTLDLGGYNITQTADGVNAINLSSGDNVTVIGSGTVTGNNNGIYVPSGATLTIDGSTVAANVYNAVYNEGTTILKSGLLMSDGGYNGIYTEGSVQINGGTVNTLYIGAGDVTVTDGTIVKNSDGDSFPADGGTLNISGGTVEGWMSPALSTAIGGGTFNGSVFANTVTGGTFNGLLTLNGTDPSISGAVINSGFTWWSNTVPTVTDVTFGANAKITSNSTGKDTGEYQINSERNGIELKTYYPVNISRTDGGSYSVTVKANGKTVATKTENSNWSQVKNVAGDEYTVTATVTAEDGYVFDGWYLNDVKLTDGVGEDGSLNTSFVVSGAVTLVAKFVDKNLSANAAEMFKDYDSTSEYTISSTDEMELFAYAVSGLGYDFSGKTVKLGANLDYTGIVYRVVGDTTHAFKGVFDGNGNTISNIASTTDGKYIGLFGQLSGATVQNLTVKNCSFVAEPTGGYAGGIVAEAGVGVTVKDCTITDVTTSGWFSGAVLGHTYGGITVENVTVTGCAASGQKGGAIAGYSDGVTIKNVSVSDVKDGAALIGHANAGTNTIENVKVDAPNAVLIKTTYSASEGSVIFKGEDTEVVAKDVFEEGETVEAKTVTIEAGKFSNGTTSLDVSDYLEDGKTQDSEGNVVDGAPAGYVEDENGNVTISSAKALFWFAKQVNEVGNTFKGKTVKLASDITLADAWTPVGVSVSKSFQGTFDGDGHTVSGVKVRGGYQEYGFGFFKIIISATVKNVTFSNADVTGAYSNVVGIVAGYSYGSSEFENVHVVDSTVYAFGKVGGFVGMAEDGGATTTFKNCSISISTIRAAYNSAAFCGLLMGACVVTGSSIENINVVKDTGSGFGGITILDTTVACDGSVASCAGNGTVIKGRYTLNNGYYWSAYSDLYNTYGNSSHDCTLADGKMLANSEVVHDAPVAIGDNRYSDLATAIAAAKDGDTVILLADITEDVVINKYITFDLGGKTITNTGAGKATLTVASGATATVKNGSIVGGASYYNIQNNGTAIFEEIIATAGNNDASMIDNYGTLTITSGTYTGGMDTVKNEPAAKLTISGGTFTLTKGTKKGFTAVVFNYGSLEISGGEFVQSDKSAPYGQAQVIHTDKSGSTAPSTVITGGTFKNLCTTSTAWAIRATNAAVGATKVSGGSFNKKVSESYCADGFIPTQNADGTYGVKVGRYIAKVGSSTKYESLAEALAAAKNGNTVTLLVDITEDVTINKNITFDLGGKTITNTGAGKATLTVASGATATVKNGSIVGGASYYTIQNNGTATLEDITATAGNNDSSMLDNYGTLTINSGAYTGGLDTIKNEPAAKLTISGGTFTLTKGTSKGFTGVIFNYGTLEISGGEFVQSDKSAPYGQAQVIHTDKSGSTAPSTVIIGGTFKNLCTRSTAWSIRATNAAAGATKVSGGSFNKKVSESYCADGFIPTQNSDGTYGVKEGSYVAKVGSTKYESLAEAVSAAKTGDTVTLLTDITLTNEYINITKSITIDGDGHSITGYGMRGTGSYETIAINQDGTSKVDVTLKNLTINNSADSTYGSPYAKAVETRGNIGTLTIENCTINCTGSGNARALTIGGNQAEKATVKIIDSTLSAGAAGYPVVLYNPVDMEITNSTLNGYCGVYFYDADGSAGSAGSALTATNSTFNCQNNYDGADNSFGVFVLQDNDINITIEDCTIDATASGDATQAVIADVIYDDVERSYTVAINGDKTDVKGDLCMNVSDAAAEGIQVSGGTFDRAVDEKYCAAGFIPAKNDDGSYGVKVGTYIAETNGVKYESLEEAINAAKSGATVKLLADTYANITITKALTIDLNGFTINGGNVKGKATIKVDNKKLTIKDTSEAQTGTIMREDTADTSSYYVIDIQGKNGFLVFEGGNVKNNSGIVGVKGSSLVRIGDDSVSGAYPVMTVKGGTFTQDNFVVIKVDRGTLHLLDGEVNSANSYAIENWNNAYIKGGTINGTVSTWVYSTGAAFSKLEISAGTINGNVCSVNYDNAADKQARLFVTGGTITGTLGTYTYDNGLVPTEETSMATIEVTGGTFDIDPTKYVTEAAKVNANDDGTFGVEKLLLAKVGDTSYYTWDEAYKAQTKSGEPIVLLRNYTTDKVLNSGSINRTIDLNGFTYKYTGKDTDCAAFEVNYANVTLTVINGTVESTQLMGLIPTAMSGTITYDNSGIIFDGVKMTAYGHAGIETNGSNENCTITLKNSELNVPNGYGINFASSGTLTIDNSVINAKTMGVQICAGSLNIVGDGTKITVAGDGVEKTENDGAIEDGAAISIVDRTGYKGLESIKIEAGTFVAKDGNAALKAYKWENKTESAFDNANDTVAVSGGTFSTEVKKDYCADGYKSVTDSNGNYTVKEANITVKVSSNISAAGTLTGGDMYAKGETVTVTAIVNPGYVFLGWYDASGKLVNANTTYTFEASENVDLIATFKGNKNVKLSVGLSGGIVTVGGDVTAKWRNDVKDNEFLLGTSFVLTAAPRAGYTFLYWINAEGRILSDEPEYKFTLGMDTSIKACFMETEQWEDSSYVIFRDNITKKIIWSGDVEMTEHSDGIYGTVAAPALLNYSGVTFTGWRDADGNVVTSDENGNIRITSNITIYAIYQATSDTFDVTVDGETVGSYGFRTSVSVTAPETKDGKYFAGWYRDGVLVSTNANYSFIIRSAIALTTEYTDTKQEPASVAILTVGDREQVESGVLAPFSLDWSLAEGCELVKVGIIRTYDASLKDKLTLENVNGSTIKTKESVLTTSDGNYLYSLTMLPETAVNDVYMTGYVMYRAANGNIITLYTDVVTSPAGN